MGSARIFWKYDPAGCIHYDRGWPNKHLIDTSSLCATGADKDVSQIPLFFSCSAAAWIRASQHLRQTLKVFR
jgi:hypothetical protein